MEIARTDRVWPHGSRAERAHPTELCSTWKATKRAGPYFWRMRGGAWLLIEQSGRRIRLGRLVVPLRRQERYSPFPRGESVKISNLYVESGTRNLLISFFLFVFSLPLHQSLWSTLYCIDVTYFSVTYFYYKLKKFSISFQRSDQHRVVDVLSTPLHARSWCLVAFSPTPAFSPFSSAFHLSKWRSIGDVLLEFEAIISIRKFRRYRTRGR